MKIGNNQLQQLFNQNVDLLKGTQIDLYGDEFSTEIHPGKFFIHLYNELCYTYVVNTPINIKVLLKELEGKFGITDSDFLVRYEQADSKNLGKKDFASSDYLIRVKDRVLMEIHNHRIVFWYGTSVNFSEIADILEVVHVSKKRKKHNRKFYMIANAPHSEFGFDLQHFDVKKVKTDIATNYNDDFLPLHQTINNFLRRDQSNGLILLHGKYGTGKTTYIRHLISTINKRFIFLPLNLMDAISSPNFLPFVAQFKNSILILEDCESLLVPRDSANPNSNSLINLLNLGDGLLSDALSIKLICTFNADLRQIDKAILRKGRLVARYEFQPLTVEKAQALATKNNINIEISQPTTLADLYNYQEGDFADFAKSGRMGF